MHYYYWATLGLVLISIDVASVGGTGFLSMIVGLAMLLVSLLSMLNVTTSPLIQVGTVVGISVFGLLCLRSFVAGRKQVPEGSSRDSLLGLHCVARQPLGPGEQGHVELHGTLWQAINRSTVLLVEDSPCEVVDVQGITLGVRALYGGAPKPAIVSS